MGGTFESAKTIALSKGLTVDLIATDSAAVSLERGRVGKDEAYSGFEYGIIRECELASNDAKIIMTAKWSNPFLWRNGTDQLTMS